MTRTIFATSLADTCAWSIAGQPRHRRGHARLLVAASERDQAADCEADDGGTNRQLAPVLTDLTAPVGELGDAPAKGLDRAGELAAVALDVGPDLVGAAPRHTGCGRAHWLAGPTDVDVR